MPAYHLRHPPHDPRLIEATQTLLATRPSTLDNMGKLDVFFDWTVTASNICELPLVPSLAFVPAYLAAEYGLYQPKQHSILFPKNKPSVITLLHEFRHSQVATTETRFMRPLGWDKRPIEEDAIAWSLSLYHQAAPQTYARLVSNKKVLHTSAKYLDPMYAREHTPAHVYLNI